MDDTTTAAEDGARLARATGWGVARADAFPRLAPIATTVLDSAGKVIGASEALQAAFGHRDLVGRHLGDLFGIDRRDFVTAMRQAAATGAALEVRHPPPAGTGGLTKIWPSLAEQPGSGAMVIAVVEVADGTRGVQGRLQQLLAINERKLAYEVAIAKCSSALLQEAGDEDLPSALEALLEAVDASSIFIEQNEQHPELGLCSSLVHEASRPGFEVDSDYWSLTPWSQLPDSYARLSRGEHFAFRVDDLGPVEAATYSRVNARSELDVPIFADGQWLGLIGFSDRRCDRDWEEAEIRLLRTAAEMIGAYWYRQRARERLERAVASAETRLRYEHALAECSAALLMGGDEHGVAKALDAILTATEATYGFVEMNVEDPNLGLCSRTVCEAELLPDGTISHELDEYWALRPWSQMPDSYSRLSRGEPFAFTVDDLGPIERQLYLDDPYPVLSEIDIPIHVDGEWAGLIGFGDRDKMRSWDPGDVRLLQTLADMVGSFWSRQRARRRLEELVRSKDEFLASVSHELRTPLTTVVGLSSELRDRDADFSAEERSEFTSLIASESAEVANLVEDLLVAARADADMFEVWPDVIDLVREVETTISGLAHAGRIDLRFDRPSTAWADPSRTRQILRNLLTNALRYGGAHVTVEAEGTRDHVLLRVIDDGPGIPPEHRAHVFEAYGRAHDRSTQPASVGLGLTVSRRLARLMDGELTYSYDRRGSVFELSLPRPRRTRRARSIDSTRE